jgi:hypothetical protein
MVKLVWVVVMNLPNFLSCSVLEVMGGSEHSQNEFSYNNIDMNANDQSKQ